MTLIKVGVNLNLAISIGVVWSKVWPVALAILFFELIIVVHEFGHFITAKLNGICVNEFAIGMGPKLFSFTKGETQYSFRLVPFGGYCTMEGEDEESKSNRSFSSKKVWQRMLVIIAGAVMNLILGFLIILIMVSQDNLVGTTQIAKFDDTAVSVNSGLQVGDEIKSINAMRVYASFDISTGFTRDEDGIVDIVVKRDGKLVKLDNVKFDTEDIDIGSGKTRKLIKMDFFILGKEKTVGNVIVESIKETVAFSRSVFLSVADLLTGHYSLSELSGPVGTVSIVAQSASVSILAMLRIMALITINIGLFNLFPIPALDGWRFFILAFEGITKKKMNKKIEWAINGVGLVLLLILMAVITFSDISKFF